MKMDRIPFLENFEENGLVLEKPGLTEFEPPQNLNFDESPSREFEYLQTKVESQLKSSQERFSILLEGLGGSLTKPPSYPKYEQIKAMDKESMIEWQLDIKKTLDEKRVELANVLESNF